MVANTVTAAGPFIVTSQDTPGTSWTQGETETITWDVAGTTSNGVDKLQHVYRVDHGIETDPQHELPNFYDYIRGTHVALSRSDGRG